MPLNISGKIPPYAPESSISVFASCREGGLLIFILTIIVIFSLAKALLKILHSANISYSFTSGGEVLVLPSIASFHRSLLILAADRAIFNKHTIFNLG